MTLRRLRRRKLPHVAGFSSCSRVLGEAGSSQIGATLDPRGALRGPLAAVGAELSAIGWALTLVRRACAGHRRGCVGSDLPSRHRRWAAHPTRRRPLKARPAAAKERRRAGFGCGRDPGLNPGLGIRTQDPRNPDRHKVCDLFGPRPRPLTMGVRGRGRGPNRKEGWWWTGGGIRKVGGGFKRSRDRRGRTRTGAAATAGVGRGRGSEAGEGAGAHGR
jgi:hypothetical protein